MLLTPINGIIGKHICGKLPVSPKNLDGKGQIGPLYPATDSIRPSLSSLRWRDQSVSRIPNQFMRAALLALLLFAAARLPATAELYVACHGSDSVKAFTKNGVPIGSGDLIGALDNPSGITLEGARLFITNNGSGNVSAYSTSGTLIAVSYFLPAPPPGVYGITSDGSRVFIVNLTQGTVTAHSASTGNAIGTPPLLSGLAGPRGVAVSGNTLYVVTTDTDSVIARDATTGAVVAGFTTITGFTEPRGIAVSGNRLYVSDFGSGWVGVYNATTGATINANFINTGSPLGLKVVDNRLYVATPGAGTVGVYDATTGATINAALVSGLNNPYDIAVAPAPPIVSNPPAALSRVTVGGKKSFKVSRPTTPLKGSANAATARVELKVGRKPYRSARGVQRWKFTASLSKGRNVITARGLNADGLPSPLVRVRVTRVTRG